MACDLNFDPTASLLFVINSSSGAQDIDDKCGVIEAALALHGRQGELRVCRPADLRRVAQDAAMAAVGPSSFRVELDSKNTM